MMSYEEMPGTGYPDSPGLRPAGKPPDTETPGLRPGEPDVGLMAYSMPLPESGS